MSAMAATTAPANTAFDLDAYLRRIGLAGSRTPDMATLQAIVLAHVRSIAFENVDPFLGREVRLDAQSLQRKLVRGGRGGYCYEHNLLLEHALRALGFKTTGLAARVLYMQADDALRPRTHMLLRVDLDGEVLLVDVGFGGLTLTGVLRLQPDVVQSTPHEPFRLLHDGETYRMQAHVGDRWRTLYRFDLQPQLLPDYLVASWYVSHHPESRFVTGLTASRADVASRHALRGTELAEHHLDGRSERRTLGDATELRGALEQTFGLTLESEPEVDAALRRLF
jgi:N-hydroxyarylamine O-acetyltransferase